MSSMLPIITVAAVKTIEYKGYGAILHVKPNKFTATAVILRCFMCLCV
jgi:hypothetical protein